VKLLFATMQFGAGYSQGTERYLSILAAGLAARGHEVIILAGDPDGRRPAAPLGAEVESAPRVLHYPARGWMTIEGTPAPQLEALLAAHTPDVVHMANPAHVGVSLIPAAAAARIPVVLTIMDYWWICPKQTLLHASGRLCDAETTWRECLACIAADRENSLRRTLARVPLLRTTLVPAAYVGTWRASGVSPAEISLWPRRREHIRAAMNAAQVVICPSQAARDLVAARLSGPRIERIPYGLEPHWFERSPRDPRAADGDRPLTLGFAGALQPHKGLHVLLDALRAAALPALQLRIAGDGASDAYRRDLEARAAGLDVEWVGRVAPRDMPAFLRSLDLLVVPSLWPENLPIIVLESCAAGVPVLGSDVAGIAEFLPLALRFRVGDAADLARRLESWTIAPRAEHPPAVSTADEMVERTAAVYASL